MMVHNGKHYQLVHVADVLPGDLVLSNGYFQGVEDPNDPNGAYKAVAPVVDELTVESVTEVEDAAGRILRHELRYVGESGVYPYPIDETVWSYRVP